MRKHCRKALWGLLFIVIGSLVAISVGAQNLTIDDQYPGLATGVLKTATLVALKDGLILTADDLAFKEKEIKDAVKKAKKKMRSQLQKNLFFVLEEKAAQRLVLREAYQAGYGKTKHEDRLVKAFLQHQVSGLTVSDEEAKAFYIENKDTIGVPFEQGKDAITGYLVQQKQEEATREYIEKLGSKSRILVDEGWVRQQYALSKNNPVDRARNSGLPTMVEFGATGCKACDMMQPILKNLTSRYKKRLNVVFIHVREDAILAKRYGITSIPVQVFFDRSGKEFFRHVGFFPQVEVEKKLVQMGI
jgi:thioredoxin 1